jgi:hypothetical protein
LYSVDYFVALRVYSKEARPVGVRLTPTARDEDHRREPLCYLATIEIALAGERQTPAKA